MERRKNYRVKTEIVLILDDNNEQAILKKAWITDLGPKGAFIESQKLPEVGTRITLSFRLPGRLIKFKIPAIVRWISPSLAGFGVQFLGTEGNINKEVAQWIMNQYIKDVK